MTPTIGKIIAGAAAVLIIIGALVFGVDSCHRRQGSAAEVQANIAKGEANAHQSQAQASDSKVADLETTVASQTKQLARVQEERDALLKRWRTRPIPPAVLPATTPDDRSELLEQLVLADAVIQKDAETIYNLAVGSTVKDSLIVQLTTSRNEWRATAEARERQALAQQAATKAWRDSVTTSRWTGRIEGALAGAAIGFLGGRR